MALRADVLLLPLFFHSSHSSRAFFLLFALQSPHLNEQIWFLFSQDAGNILCEIKQRASVWWLLPLLLRHFLFQLFY